MITQITDHIRSRAMDDGQRRRIPRTAATLCAVLVATAAAVAWFAVGGAPSARGGTPAPAHDGPTVVTGTDPGAQPPPNPAPTEPGPAEFVGRLDPCECEKVDASLDVPTAAEEAEPWLTPVRKGYTMFRFAVDATLTCTRGAGDCEGDVIVRGAGGARVGYGKRGSRTIECEGPCGATTTKRVVVPILIPTDTLDDDEPVDVEIQIHAYCPGKKRSTKPKTVTLNFLNGKFRPRHSDLDGDGKADRKKK